MLVRELYRDSLMYEEGTLAHYIHHLLSKEIITLDDDVETMDLTLADYKEVAEMIRINMLGFSPIQIYSLKMNQNDFAFIFAENRQEAIGHYMKTFNQKPLNCLPFSLDYELARGNEVVSFRDMRKEFDKFPAVAGFFRREG